MASHRREYKKANFVAMALLVKTGHGRTDSALGRLPLTGSSSGRSVERPNEEIKLGEGEGDITCSDGTGPSV